MNSLPFGVNFRESFCVGHGNLPFKGVVRVYRKNIFSVIFNIPNKNLKDLGCIEGDFEVQNIMFSSHFESVWSRDSNEPLLSLVLSLQFERFELDPAKLYALKKVIFLPFQAFQICHLKSGSKQK